MFFSPLNKRTKICIKRLDVPTCSAIWSKTLNCSPRGPPDALYEALLSALDALLLLRALGRLVDFPKLGGREVWEVSHVLSYTPMKHALG